MKTIEETVKELTSWKKWKKFHKAGGVPGCRINEKASVQEIAAQLVAGGIDGYDGTTATESTDRETLILDVSDMINADNAYSPDF